MNQELVNELRQKVGGLNLMPTKEEYYQAMCTHRDVNTGNNVLVASEDGTELNCPICSAAFHSLSMNESEVSEATETIVDVLQNIKMMYLDIPTEVCREYMKIIPMIEKIPQLYKIAAANYRQYENAVTTVNNGPSSLISQYNYVTGPTAMYGVPQPQMQMPMMGQQYPYPTPNQGQEVYMQPQQPMNQQMGMPQQMPPMMNPMGGYNDMVMGGYNPQQMQMTDGFNNPFYGQQPQFTQMNQQSQNPQQCACGHDHAQQGSPVSETVTVEKKFNV